MAPVPGTHYYFNQLFDLQVVHPTFLKQEHLSQDVVHPEDLVSEDRNVKRSGSLFTGWCCPFSFFRIFLRLNPIEYRHIL